MYTHHADLPTHYSIIYYMNHVKAVYIVNHTTLVCTYIYVTEIY